MNVLKFGRKVLTVGTVFSTILWSVGVSALVPAMAQAQTSCPAFQPGDMIKVTGHPAIYSVDANGKVLYFPSGDEFKSWNAGETYGGYTSVSQSCFDSLPVPTMAPLGVNFRPGSYVVKRPSSDQLYVVEPGNKLATITTDAAKGLYGASFKVKTVADVFWPNYGNNRGTPVTSAVAHPGMLVSNGGNTYYVDSTGVLRQVTAAGFTANRFKQAFVRPVASIAGFSMGAQITSAESTVLDRTQTGVTGGSTTPVTGGAVSVSLASDNPAGTVLASGTAFNPVLKVNLTAGSQDVSVTGLTVRKSGLAANTSVSGADVIDSSGVRHGNVASSVNSDNDLQLLFTGSPIVVRAGTTQTVTVRVNIATSGTSGTIQFSLVGPASVTGATASGNFPVAGNTFTLQDGSNAIGAVSAAVTNVGTSTLSVDTTNEQDITKFTLTSGNSFENILVKSLALYNNGTAADTDVQDVQLVSQEGTVLATAQQVSKVVTFNLVSAYSIDKGTAKTFTIRAKVVNGAGRTINFTVYNNYDLGLQGATTGANLIATGSFPLGTAQNTMTVGSGSLSFNKDVSSPSTAITPGANSVVLAKFYAKPTGEDMELRQVTLGITSSTPVLTGSLVIKVNGSSVWSGTGTGFGTSTVTLSTYPVISAGQNSYITVEGNIMSAVSSGNVSASMKINQVRRVLTNDIIDPTVNTAYGNQLTIQAAAVKVTTLATPAAQSVVVGTNGVTLANFEFNAGSVSSGEDVKVTSFVVNDTAVGGFPQDIGNLVLYDANGNALATSNSTVSAATNTTFNLINPIVIPKAGAVTLTLKGDVLTGTGTSDKFAVTDATTISATGVTTGNTLTGSAVTVAGAGQVLTIATQGTLTVSIVSGASGAPSSDQTAVAGQTGLSVYAFKLSAQKEAMKIRGITLTASGTIGTVNDITNVRLTTDSGASVGSAVAQGTLGTNTTTYTWTAADQLLTVQPGTPVTIYVKADVGGQGLAKLGDSFVFKINSSTTDITGIGAASAQAFTASGAPAATGKTYVVPFSVSVAADYPTTPQTVLVAGSRLGTVKITNNGSAPVTITNVKFTDNGAHATNDWVYSAKYSSENSADYSANTIATSTGLTFTPSFTISGGAYRYVSVYLNSGTVAASGDSAQISVAAIGDIKFSANEADLGYDVNADGDVVSGDNATALVTTGLPSLATVSK